MIEYIFDQASQEWYDIKAGKITGSRMKRVMQKSNLDLVYELIAELETGKQKQINVSEAMQRGLDLEPVAKAEYETYTGSVVKDIGFWQHGTNKFLGVSPDGVISENGAIEIKCPDTKKHVEYILIGRIPNEYKYQVYTYFLVNESLEWLDFVSFDPRFRINPIHIHRITRKEIKDKLILLEKDLLKFWDKVIEKHNLIKF